MIRLRQRTWGDKISFIKVFAVLAGTSGGDCFFIKKSSLALAGARRGEFRRVRSVLFCYATEKEQFDYAFGIIKFKRMHQRLDTPNSLDGLVVAGSGLFARTVPASRLSVTHALSPLGLAERVLKAFFLNLS